MIGNSVYAMGDALKSDDNLYSCKNDPNSTVKFEMGGTILQIPYNKTSASIINKYGQGVSPSIAQHGCNGTGASVIKNADRIRHTLPRDSEFREMIANMGLDNSLAEYEIYKRKLKSTATSLAERNEYESKCEKTPGAHSVMHDCSIWFDINENIYVIWRFRVAPEIENSGFDKLHKNALHYIKKAVISQ